MPRKTKKKNLLNYKGNDRMMPKQSPPTPKGFGSTSPRLATHHKQTTTGPVTTTTAAVTPRQNRTNQQNQTNQLQGPVQVTPTDTGARTWQIRPDTSTPVRRSTRRNASPRGFGSGTPRFLPLRGGVKKRKTKKRRKTKRKGGRRKTKRRGKRKRRKSKRKSRRRR